MPSYTVHARWDPASATWWTDGEDIPGLTCQADSFEELLDVIFELGPELLRDNGIEVTAIHNHMVGEDPPAFFIHFWANDDAVKLASGLGAALKTVNVPRS